MYDDLRGRLKELAKIELADDGMGIIRISAEGLEIIRGIAQAAEAAIEDLSEQINERKTTPPETGEPTIYERQIMTNQAVIMGALAELMPNEGADQLLENMYVSAIQTMKILKEADKEKEA